MPVVVFKALKSETWTVVSPRSIFGLIIKVKKLQKRFHLETRFIPAKLNIKYILFVKKKILFFLLKKFLLQNQK